MDNITETVRKRYNRIAPIYDRIQAVMEKGKMKEWRGKIWRQARGKILEVGVGTGNNIPYYPENIEITAIDLSERMLEKAREKAAIYGKQADLRLMDLGNLDFPNSTFDTVLTTCVFCSVPDLLRGLSEIRRVLKKDGHLIMVEHVRSTRPVIGLMMDWLNPLVVRVIGANINRRTVTSLQMAGFKVEVEENLMLDIVKYLDCQK